MELRIFPEFQGKIPGIFIILYFLRSQYVLNILINCYLSWILEEGRKKFQIFTFLFQVCIFQPPCANSWVKDTFSWRLFSVKRTMFGKWNTWERDVWKQKIPVISSGQAPVSHQGPGQHKWFWQKVCPSCPISQANIWEPNGPRKYLFPKSVNDRLQRAHEILIW